MKHNLILFALSFLSLASCAGTTQIQQYPALDPATAPTAVVHVVRRNSAYGSAIKAPVYIDQHLIGNVGPGGHVTTRVPVGKIFVSSSTADIVVDTEKGKYYFFEITMPLQTWIATPDFNIKTITTERAREIVGYDLNG